MKGGITAAWTVTWNYFSYTVAKLREDTLKASAKWLPVNSHPRNLSEQGIKYLSGPITDSSFESENGYIIFETPLKDWAGAKRWLGLNDAKYICVVTDPNLIKSISDYGYFNTKTYDNELRKNMRFFHKLTNYPILLSKNDNSVIPERKDLRKTLSNTDWINPVLYEGVSEWLKQVDGKTVDFTDSFKIAMFKIICKALIGIDTLPEGKKLYELIHLVNELDEHINLDPDSLECQQVALKMQSFSKWILENNKQSMLSRRNMVTDLIKKEDIEKINIGLILAATSNITRLLITTLSFLAYHPKWQSKVRKAFQQDGPKDREFLDRFYKECCRLFISTAFTTKSLSKKFEMTTEKGEKISLPEGTSVFIPHRRLDFYHYKDPETFNPDRSEFLPTEPGIEPIKINTLKLSPFGLGQRACPASTTFTEPAFYAIIKLIISHCVLLKPKDCKVIFEIPSERSPYAKLTNDYFVTVNKILPVKPLNSDQTKMEKNDIVLVNQAMKQLCVLNEILLDLSSDDEKGTYEFNQEVMTNFYNLHISSSPNDDPQEDALDQRKNKSPLRRAFG